MAVREPVRFRAVVQRNGKTATGIAVPDEVVEQLGAGRRPPVAVTLNGHTYRTTVASMGGVYMIPVSGDIRAAARVGAGDELVVDVSLDTAPRTVELPSDLAAALTPAARARFDALSNTEKKRHVYAIEQAKTPETRARRIAKVVDAMTC